MLSNVLAYILAGALTVTTSSGCASISAKNAVQDTAVPTNVLSQTAYTQFTAEYSARDCDPSYDEATAHTILFSDGTAQISGGAVIDKKTVTITEKGTYILSGATTDASVIVDVPEADKVQLVLNNVSISSTDGPAIYAQQCDKLFVTLVGENSLADSTTYTLDEGEDEPNAVLFAKSDMTINGGGSLTINGAYKYGINTKDDLTITGGTINVNSPDDGVRGRDSVYIKDGTLNITSGGDGIKSNNDTAEDKGRISIDGGCVNITAENDGIQAESVLQINGGVINIKSGDEENTIIKSENNKGGGKGGMMRPDGVPEFDRGNMQRPDGAPEFDRGNIQRSDGAPEFDRGGMSENMQSSTYNTSTESKKGIKSSNALYISGGTLTFSSEDDSIHAAVAVEINSGDITIKTCDDAVHADYSCVVNGGNINVTKCYEGLEGKTVIINDGTIHIKASDDGINASDPNGSSRPGAGSNDVYIAINGGTVNVISDYDSLDANGSIYIKGGSITLDGPSKGMDSAIDCDGKAYIYGGTVAASGAGNGSTIFDASSTQPSVMVTFTSQQSSGTTAVIKDSNGSTLASVTPEKSYGGVVFSSPEMKIGETYTVTAGTVSTTITLTSVSTSVNENGEAVQTSGKGGMGRPDGTDTNRPTNGNSPSRTKGNKTTNSTNGSVDKNSKPTAYSGAAV